MTTLVVPDVHEQWPQLQKVIKLFDKAERVVFLGDFFDTFGNHAVEEMVAFINETHDDPKIEKCLGNHELNYFFTNAALRCSGYNPLTAYLVKARVTSEVIRGFKLFVRVGKFVVSHAGFHPATLHWLNDQAGPEAIESGLRGEAPRPFGAGRARGGPEAVGGPLWLDWNTEFEPMHTPQIVGHTYSRKGEVRTMEDDGILSWCIDTGLKHVLWTDGEEVSVEPLD